MMLCFQDTLWYDQDTLSRHMFKTRNQDTYSRHVFKTHVQDTLPLLVCGFTTAGVALRASATQQGNNK